MNEFEEVMNQDTHDEPDVAPVEVLVYGDR